MSSKHGGRKRYTHPNSSRGKRRGWLWREHVERATRCTHCGTEQGAPSYAFTAYCINPKCKRAFDPNAPAGKR